MKSWIRLAGVMQLSGLLFNINYMIRQPACLCKPFSQCGHTFKMRFNQTTKYFRLKKATRFHRKFLSASLQAIPVPPKSMTVGPNQQTNLSTEGIEYQHAPIFMFHNNVPSSRNPSDMINDQIPSLILITWDVTHNICLPWNFK